MITDKIVLENSDEAAKFVEDCRVTGWISRKGNYYGNGENAERLARYDGATHKLCATCGTPIQKHSFCRECSYKRETEKSKSEYAAMPRKKWDGETPLYSMRVNEWFYDEDAIDSFLEEQDEDSDIVTPGDLMLVIGDPVYAWELDPNEVYQDHLDVDAEVSTAIAKLFDELNAKLRECKIPLSWTTTSKSFAVDMEGWDHA